MAGIPGCRSRFLHQLGTGLFTILPPPPIPFSIAIIYKVSPFYLFTFRRAGNAKTPFPCRSRQRKGVLCPAMGGAAGSLQKAILLPTGRVCFEQEKRGPVYPHLVQLSLESFSAPLYNILVIRNKGVPDESSPTHLGRLFFLPAFRGTLRNVPPRWTAI